MPSSALATAPSTPRRPVVGAASAQPGGRKNRVVRRRSRPTRASSSTTPITNEDWEASSPIAFDASLDDALACDKVVVLGARASLTSPALVDALPPPIAAVWTDAVRLTPAGDGGGKRSLMVRVETNGEDGGSGTRLVEVVVGVLPPSVSRHNCSAAPFAVSTILAGVSAPADPARALGIVTALRRDADAIPIATAVARCFPLYTAKSVAGRDTAEGRGKIAERGRVRVASVVVGKDATVASEVTPTSDAAAAAAAAAARGVRFAGRLVDAPPAAMDPDAIVREAEAVVARLRATLASDGGAGATISSDVLRYDALKRGGFGGLVAVGDAAARDGREPALVHVKYTPPPPSGGESDARRVVALVGKGITFDTGGLQIKGKSGMPGMKSDMGGAAAMLAAFEAVCVLRPAHLRELHLVLCVAENAVGPAAFRPDDVVVPLSGRTIEVNNTDAEGRVVLADGVAFASGPIVRADDVIDMATLTGAQMVATGRHFAGIVSDDEAMERACEDAGRRSGDLCHALPYAPEFFTREFSSKVADMRNSVKDRSNAQASCAGQFIANHLDPGWGKKSSAGGGGGGDDDEGGGGLVKTRRWLHVDMAGPSTEKGSGRGTGYGVSLLVELLTGSFYR